MYADLMDSIGFVAGYDKEVGDAMNAELARQRRNLELIASENIVSPAVMAAMGSVLTNKYAEGYSGQAVLRRLRVRGRCGGYCESPALRSCSAQSL